MTSLPPQDPLVALWQTTPAPDSHHLLRDLQRLKRLRHRLNRTVLAILSGVAILLIFEEATGRIASHGILSVTWTLGLVVAAAWRRQARCNRSDELTLDTVSLLTLMLKRAKSDLFLARCLYAGVPVGAVAGFVLAELAGIGASPSANAVGPRLHLIQTGSGIAALIVMMVAGVVLARSRRVQVRELGEKLKSIEASL